jgi:hypothetical protein
MGLVAHIPGQDPMYRLPSMSTPPRQQCTLKDNGFLQKLK